MPKSDSTGAGHHIEISIPDFEPVRLCPFNSGLTRKLTLEFEKRCRDGHWCGFATLGSLPQNLPALFSHPRTYTTDPLCTVIFLQQTGAKNFLFQSPQYGFVLLDERFHLLYQSFSLSETLDNVQESPTCH